MERSPSISVMQRSPVNNESVLYKCALRLCTVSGSGSCLRLSACADFFTTGHLNSAPTSNYNRPGVPRREACGVINVKKQGSIASPSKKKKKIKGKKVHVVVTQQIGISGVERSHVLPHAARREGA